MGNQLKAMKQALAALEATYLSIDVPRLLHTQNKALELLRDAIAAEEAGSMSPVAWLSQCKSSGLVEQVEPNEKATNPSKWTDAFPVFTHPAPAKKPMSDEREALIKRLNDYGNITRNDVHNAIDMLAAYEKQEFQTPAKQPLDSEREELIERLMRGYHDCYQHVFRRTMKEACDMLAADAHVPMTIEQILNGARETTYFMSYIAGIRHAESHHGIKP